MTIHPSLDDLREGFSSPPRDALPMMRWWWFGPRVDRSDLLRDLTRIKAAGFGGVELSVVYPLSEDTDRYMSDSFLSDVRFAAESARERDLRFDLTLGSGWSFGGPHISAADAARRLWWDRRDIGVEAAEIPVSTVWPGDEFVAAYVGDGSLQEPPEQFDLLDSAGGSIRIPAGKGPRVVLLVTARLTGQQVKRAASGAEGCVLDHYSRSATAAHIAAVCDPLLDAVPADLLGSVFCDSLEAYSADWTGTVLDEFRVRRGYDPLPSLAWLHIPADAGASFRADYYRTLTELYEENFVQPLRDWSASRGVELRIQGYGEPPAGISSYRFADRFEGEGWGWKELTQTRWATAAAHLYDRQVVSSETWTWIHSPSLRATPMDLRGEAHEHILAGINHFIGHGWPSSPSDAPGLGWVLYAAGAFDDRNPWSPAMPHLAAYLHRLSWLMRQGSPINEVGLYAGARDAYASMRSDTESSLNLWQCTKIAIGDEIPAALRENGYDYDAWDDDAAALAVDRFSVIVLPRVHDLPDSTARELSTFVARGGSVIAIGCRADAVTGAILVADEGEMLAALDRVIGPDAAATPRAADLGVTHRRIGDADLYFVANTGAQRIRTALMPRTSYASVERWDAATGATETVDLTASAGIPVDLEAYEAAVFVTHQEQAAGGRTPVAAGSASLELREWTASFGAQEHTSVALPHRWENEPDRAGYSGSASYATSFVLEEGDPLLNADDLVLDFGSPTPIEAGVTAEIGIRGRSFRVGVTPPVGEIAEVTVNGRALGVVWGTPYRISVGDALRIGANTVDVRVSNTAGNALAHDPAVVADAERSTAWHGRRFRMQDFELADDNTSSGMLAVPFIRSLRQPGR